MICKKCGNQVQDGAKFCNICGNNLTLIEQSPNVQVVPNTNQNFNNYQNNSDMKSDNKNGLALASLIIGIVAVVLSIIFNVFVIPLAITGLVLGLVSKEKNTKKRLGIILNSVSIVIAILIIILVSLSILSSPNFWDKLYDELDYSANDNYVSGTWNCKVFDGSGPGEDYIVTMKLNKDLTFVWNKYGDEKNNHVYGNYTFEDENKINNSGDYRYFMLNLDGHEFVDEGVLQDQKYKSEYEMGINNVVGEAILINVVTYNMYYCYRN